MFKAVLQRNQTALKGLLRALLHMQMEEIIKYDNTRIIPKIYEVAFTSGGM